MMKLVGLAIAAFLASSIVSTAHAGSEGAWKIASSTEDQVVRSIAYGNGDSNGVLLSCVEGQLHAVVGMEAGDIIEMIGQQTSRQRTNDLVLTIGDDEYRSAWTYLPSIKVALSREPVAAKKIYNAAVRGETVSFELAAKDPVTVEFPAMNDAFKRFANDCTVTNPG